MKRVKAACLMQTLCFGLKEDISHEDAVRQARSEVERYKEQLNRRGVRHVIDEEREEPDGSVTLRIRKQYVSSPVGEYLD